MAAPRDSDGPDRGSRPVAPGACPFCRAPRTSTHCDQCDQTIEADRLSLPHIVRSLWREVVDLDLPLLRTVVGLATNPGRVCREYVFGQRRIYSNPIRYVIIMVALLAITTTVLDINMSAAVSPGNFRVGTSSPAGKTSEQINADKVARMVQSNLNYFAMLALPCVVVALRVLFWRTRLNLAEHAVFTMFVFGQVFLYGMLFALAGAYSWLPTWIAVRVLEAIYTIWAAVGFYRCSVLMGTLKMIALWIIYTVAMFILVFIAILVVHAAGGF